MPVQRLGIEDRAIDADAVIIPAIVDFDRCHAAKADADAAGHGGFQGKMAGDAALFGLIGQGLEHRLRAAAEEMLRGVVRGE